jgi:hypothetical protein
MVLIDDNYDLWRRAVDDTDRVFNRSARLREIGRRLARSRGDPVMRFPSRQRNPSQGSRRRDGRERSPKPRTHVKPISVIAVHRA